MHARRGLRCASWNVRRGARIEGYLLHGGPQKLPGRKGMFEKYVGPNGEVQWVRVRRACKILQHKVRTSTRKPRKDAGIKRGPRKLPVEANAPAVKVAVDKAADAAIPLAKKLKKMMTVKVEAGNSTAVATVKPTGSTSTSASDVKKAEKRLRRIAKKVLDSRK